VSGRRLGLLAGLVLVVAVNAVVLAGVAWNRSAVDARVELTERECPLPFRMDDEDTGLELRLVWRAPDQNLDAAPPWLGRNALRSLGFDVSVPPADPKAESFYARALPRGAFVVLEMDGPAWRHWLEARKRELSAQKCCNQEDLDREERIGSRLVAVAAGLDARALRASYPDRSRDLILPAQIRLSRMERPDRPAVLYGTAELRSHQVPVPLSLRPVLDAVRRGPVDRDGPKAPRYRLTLATGKRHEPWLESVERLPPSP
jgi:hypothetical protein